MELADILVSDLNALPYFITEAQTGQTVPVRFEPLALDDISELQSDTWNQAVFSAVWQNYAGDTRTYKLVCTAENGTRIQGITRLGKVLQFGGLLEKSLLETAPFNRTQSSQRQYRGVGRVLIARLVVESHFLGARGKVRVKPRRGTEAFYEVLGFRKFAGDYKYMELYPSEAEQLLNQSLLNQ